MADRDAEFIRAILDAPFDDRPRLVYADWLEDLGDPRSEFLRLQEEIRGVDVFGPEYMALAEREREIVRGLDRRWLDKVRRFTTPPDPVGIDHLLPDWVQFQRDVIRLHPHPAITKWDADLSKVGGPFLWPAYEPWPVCEARGLPLVPVLQLRRIDVPTIEFPEGLDLLQLMWEAAFFGDLGDYVPHVFWRRAADVAEVGPTPGKHTWDDDEDLIIANLPWGCAMYPERVTTYPHVDELGFLAKPREREFWKQLEEINWTATDDDGVERSLEHNLWCCGWYAGGFCSYKGEDSRYWQHVLRLTPYEGDPEARWLPLEDHVERSGIAEPNRDPTGLSFGDSQQGSIWVCNDGRMPNVKYASHD